MNTEEQGRQQLFTAAVYCHEDTKNTKFYFLGMGTKQLGQVANETAGVQALPAGVSKAYTAANK